MAPPIADVLRTRTPMLFSALTDEAMTQFAANEPDLRLLRELGPRSLMVLPMLARDRVIGLQILGAKEPGRYESADLGLAQEIANRVALMAENARLTRAREEFISTAVHEIKTPIAVIKMAVQLVEQMPLEQRERRLPEMLGRLDRQCNRLTRLVTDVLEVSRIDLKRVHLTRVQTNIAALVARVVAELQNVSSRHRLVIVNNDPAQAEVDADRIEQVLTNLIDNGVKYSPGGGAVEIGTHVEGAELVVYVRDRGIGIPADKQEGIFERFYRAHAGLPYGHAASLGVGLYLSREFVSRHGGRMWFESAENEGSTFYFSLPLLTAAS